ncbi:MAG: helix-turn-helix domain-containing protein [Alkalispirochaeta sp.]
MSFTVLIADDEQLEREALTEVVKTVPDIPFTVFCAATGTEALSIVRRVDLDLAFLDIAMPGHTGLEIAEVIREKSNRTALVFVTAFDYFKYAQTAIRLHAEDFLVKPVEDDAVQRIVRRVYERQAHQQGLVEQKDRLSEVTRFLEQELLDDIIAGDLHHAELTSAFRLLGVTEIVGIALVVEPDISAYPFPLETTRQHRTMVQRAIKSVVHELPRKGVRVLTRTHSDTGYVILLRTDRRDDPFPDPGTFSDTAIAHLRSQITKTLSLPVQISATPPFSGITAMSEAIRTLRHTPGHNRPATPTAVSVSPDVQLQRRILKAIVDNNPPAFRQASAQMWDLLRGAPPAHTATLLEHANRTLGFLLRTVQTRGAATLPEDDFLIPPTTREPQTLRIEFTRRILSLLDHAPQPIGNSFVRNVREFIQNHYQTDIRLTDIAGHLNLSPSHCSREISRHFGLSFRQVLRDIRLEAARQLLADAKLSIREVADNAGFSDANYFSRVFHAEHGMSPRDFRRTIL